MRCKKHAADFSSGVGVCATCLRDRLFAIMEAQAQAERQLQLQRGDYRKSEPPPPLAFPRSVSPYVARREKETETAAWNHRGFYSTPQIGPTATASAAIAVEKKTKRNGDRFSSLFKGLFRSKSDKLESGSGRDPDPVESCSSSPWFTTMIPHRRKKQIRSLSVNDTSIGAHRKPCRNRDRGMSPAKYSDDENDEHCHGGSSGYSSESSHGWMQTPRRTPAAAKRAGGRAPGHSRNVSGLAFCLSPLVRASPNRHWNQKGVAPEAVLAGESRAPAKPHLFAAASFCKNRSRKLADFGRYNSRH